MNNNNDNHIRELLKKGLIQPMAHATFEHAIKNFPEEFINKVAENSPHSFYELLDHIRLAFLDLVDYMVDDNYKLGVFPDDYWPSDKSKEITVDQWNTSINQIRELYKVTLNILDDLSIDLYNEMPLRRGTGHTFFREILITIDHNAFHVGQIVFMRKLLNIWN